MTKIERVDAARKRREHDVDGARARRRLSSAVDAQRRLNASQEASSPVPERDRGTSRYAYLGATHD
jgi:hypothetical protein